MTSSQEVFALRRQGRLDEALVMGRQRMVASDRDEWDLRAYAWVLIDLIKAAARVEDGEAALGHASALRALEPPKDDEVLTKERRRALSLLEEGAGELARAREHSKAGRFRDAAAIYADLARRGLLGPESRASYGWDLYKATKELLGKTPPEDLPPAIVGEARRHLNAYMGLEVERPSRLHSCMLRIAARLASGDHLRMLPFARLWGLEHLQPEDFEPFVSDDGKSFPSLAEKVVMKAAKEAAEAGNQPDVEAMLPFVDRLMKRFPENHWLELSKVKLLRALGRQEEARDLALSFARSKAQEYWAWELLGDLQENRGTRLACYCKALTCSQEDSFVSPLRLKLAREFLEAGHAAEAKGEVERVYRHKTGAGHRVPNDVQTMMAAAWYASADAAPPGPGFYARFTPAADELLFAALPWTDACLGETFVIEGQESKPRRRLYLRTGALPSEVAVPESRVRLRGARVGQPVRVKADHDPNGERRFTLHALAERQDGMTFDIFPEIIGVIDHVNGGKGVFHFSAGREVQGTFALADYSGQTAVGAFVALRLATYQSRKGGGVRAVAAEPTDRAPKVGVCRSIRSSIRVRNGLGFTEDGIFIPPDLVADNDLNDEDVVSGVAVQSFDKKKNTWGWKAITVARLTTNGITDEKLS